MIYDKSHVAVIWWQIFDERDGRFEMIYDRLFESVAVSIGVENRNGDENTIEVAVRQGIFRA